MRPKEKAKQLVNKYKKASFNCTGCDVPYCDVPCTWLSIEEAKECALIAVDEILDFQHSLFMTKKTLSYKYWQQVKEEIQKL